MTLGLEPNEELLDTVLVSYARRFTTPDELRRATERPDPKANPNPSLRTMLGRGPGGGRRSGIGAYRKWCQHADSVGFPVGGMVMTLAITNLRLLVYRPTFVRGRPKLLVGGLPLRSISQCTMQRGILHHRIIVLFSDGGLVEVEPMWRRQAKAFVRTVEAART